MEESITGWEAGEVGLDKTAYFSREMVIHRDGVLRRCIFWCKGWRNYGSNLIHKVLHVL